MTFPCAPSLLAQSNALRISACTRRNQSRFFSPPFLPFPLFQLASLCDSPSSPACHCDPIPLSFFRPSLHPPPDLCITVPCAPSASPRRIRRRRTGSACSTGQIASSAMPRVCWPGTAGTGGRPVPRILDARCGRTPSECGVRSFACEHALPPREERGAWLLA